MPANTRRSAVRLVVMVLLVVLAGGCAGEDARSTAASPATTATTAAPTTTAAPATTTVPAMTAEELAWLKVVMNLRGRIDKSFPQGSLYMTRAKMLELGNALGTCSRELRRIGSPSDLLQPVHVILRKACRTYDKGAKCFATAARASDASGGVVAGTPEARTQDQALECGFAAHTTGGDLLGNAEAEGTVIEAQAGR